MSGVTRKVRESIDIPTLSTARLKLRPFVQSDSERWWELLKEPGVLRYFPNSAPVTKEGAEKIVAHMMDHWQRHGYGPWAVEPAGGGALMGRCGLLYLAETDSVEVDYILGRDYWGQGFATEAACASVDYAFEVLHAGHVTGIVHRENLASQRVLEKLGMKRLRAAQFFGIDCYEYQMERPITPAREGQAFGGE